MNGVGREATWNVAKGFRGVQPYVVCGDRRNHSGCWRVELQGHCHVVSVDGVVMLPGSVLRVLLVNNRHLGCG